MAHIHADGVADTSSTAGTGDQTVSGTAPTGFRTFSAVCSTNDTFFYFIRHRSANEWEAGLGTYSGVNTVARTTVIKSSNANAAVNFSSGTKDIFISAIADRDNPRLGGATTDNAVTRFDGTTGNVQNSGVIIDDSNNVTGVVALTTTGAISAGTSNPVTVGTIELGHASDTTLSRSAAGVVAVEGNILKQVGKETIWVPASAMVARTSTGAASGSVESTTNKVMLKTLDFDPASNEYAQFSIRMPKSWNEGTVTAAFTWTANSTSTNDVIWGLQGVALSDDDAADTAFGTAQEVTDANKSTAYKISITSATSAITIAGSPAAEDWVVFQVYRNAASTSDTLTTVDALLLGVTLYITTDAANDA